MTSDLFDVDVKVLEIGCFSGNNIRFFIERGWQVCGTELNQEMVSLGVDNLSRLGYTAPEIRIGDNLHQPWLDGEFDLLVAINTLHYSTGADVFEALQEYRYILISL